MTPLEACQSELTQVREELATAVDARQNLTADLARSQAALVASQSVREELGIRLADLGAATALPRRVKLPAERRSLTHKFTIHAVEKDADDRPVPVDYDGYLIIGLYPSGEVGEFFLRLAKQGSIVGGFADQWAIACSLLLQLGHPLEDLCRRFKDTAFEPSGRTETPGIRTAKSVIDYISRYLLRRFVMKLELVDDEPQS